MHMAATDIESPKHQRGIRRVLWNLAMVFNGAAFGIPFDLPIESGVKGRR
jgi:hypothetical protein